MNVAKKNIVVMISDQQRYDTLTNPQCLTPNLDRLKGEGVLFENAYTVNAICAPSRASFMSARYPHTHGMVDNPHTVEPFRASLQEELDLFPSLLAEQGYHVGYFGKWHVERSNDQARFGIAESMNETEIPQIKRTITQGRRLSQNGYNDRLLYGVHEEGSEETEEHLIFTKGIEFLEKVQEKSEPWCLFVSTNAPHDPYVPPRDMYELYKDKPIDLPPSFSDDLEDRPNIYKRLKTVLKDLKPHEYQEMTRCYFALCTLVDTQIGRLMEALDASGQRENTVVVFMSDHGDLLGAHGLVCKGIPAFEEAYHIPLIISDSRFSPAAISQKASIIDVAPTILELAGCKPFPKADGESLVPYLTGERTDDRAVYAEFYGQRFSATQRIVWKDTYKYVFNGFDNDELYDLATDPHEMHNLAGKKSHKDVAESMCRTMWDKAKASGDSCFLESEYYMFRFAPVGPEKKQAPSIYNKDA